MARYIDADKLIEWLDAGHLRSANEVCLSENNVLEMIKSQPTADVLVPPCKIGADVWWLDKEEGTVKCEKNGIKAVCYDGKKWTAITCDESYPEEIGTDWLMLTKEEAEERLERWNNEQRAD